MGRHFVRKAGENSWFSFPKYPMRIGFDFGGQGVPFQVQMWWDTSRKCDLRCGRDPPLFPRECNEKRHTNADFFFSRNPLVIGSNLSETPILPVQSLESSMISITSQKNRFAKNIPVNVPLCSVWPKSTHSCSWTRTLHGICFCSPLNSWRWSLFSLSLCSKCALPACWLVACASAKESRNYRNWKRLCPLHRSLEQDLTQSRNWLGISSVSQCKSRWLGRGQHFWQSQKHFLVSWFSHLFHEAFPGCIFFFKIVCSEQNWVS